MNLSSLWQGRRFEALVHHLEAFSEAALRRLALLYQTPAYEPRALALAWCLNPEALRQTVTSRVRGAHAFGLLSDLVLDHDYPVGLGWSDRAASKLLSELGLVHPADGSNTGDELVMPGALALILAPRTFGMRPSLPLLLGRLPHAQLAALSRELGLPSALVQLGHIPCALAIIEWMERPEAIEELIARLDEPDWIGIALAALELGGVCYWQEVFGDEPQAPLKRSPEDKVIPLMRFQERMDERGAADRLFALGILFRLPGEDDSGQDSIAIPEELWQPMWRLGQDWLFEWISDLYAAIEENAAVHRRAHGVDDPLLRMKWLAAELMRRPLDVHAIRDAQALAQDVDPTPITPLLELMREAGLLLRGRDRYTLRPERLDLLEGTRQSFVRNLLVGWCVSDIGWAADQHIGRALGIDEPWRRAALELWRKRREDSPAWLRAEGIETELTGAGYLRSLETGTDDLLEREISAMDVYVANAKLLWLDLLSTLEPERWYPPGLLTELLQLCFACALLDRLEVVLMDPAGGHYMPVQRPSYITDVFHSSAFDEWIDGILDHIFAPLGIARREQEQERVWLDTRPLRLDSVAEEMGISDELRVKRLRDIFQREDLPFKLSGAGALGRPVLSVATLPAPGHISLHLPIRELLEVVDRAPIIAYHGKTIEIATPAEP
jgi:hypothetical protein